LATKVPIRESEPGDIARLTRRLAAGDEEAFREFHARYFDRLYQFLLVIERGHEDQTREALQQTLLRVARYARVFESEEAFWGWLKVLARSAARDAARIERRYLGLLRKFAFRQRDQPVDLPAGDESFLGAAMEDCLAELNTDDRRLLEGKYAEGATVKELSEQTGLTEKAVESRLTRLRRNLRERLLNKLRAP
jgi:RNA polymerase sigma-70 factor, ECF subfamily